MTTQPPDMKKALDFALAWKEETSAAGTGARYIVALLDAYEASARDAERYRWLRDIANPDAEVSGISVQEQCFNSWGKPSQIHYSGENLDVAIDAARHATQGG